MDFLTSDEAELFCLERIQGEVNGDELNKIIDTAKKYKLEKLEFDVYKKFADLHFMNYKYTDAAENYIKVLNYYIEDGISANIPFLYNIIGACKYAELDYKEALTYFDKANIYAVLYNDYDIEIKALFNSALSYKKLLWLDKAIEYTDMCIGKMSYDSDSSKYAMFHILKMNCYFDMKEHKKALEVCDKLVREMKEKYGSTAAHIYNNIANLYLESGEIEESTKYFSKSEQIRFEKEPEKLSHTIIDKSVVYIKKDLYDQAEATLERGIKLALSFNDFEYALRGYDYLTKVYKTLRNGKKVEESYLNIIKLLKDKKLGDLKKTYLEISKYYIENGKLDKADEFMKLAQEEN